MSDEGAHRGFVVGTVRARFCQWAHAVPLSALLSMVFKQPTLHPWAGVCRFLGQDIAHQAIHDHVYCVAAEIGRGTFVFPVCG
jgi:hypothetical protein